jgi:hypothetical protein
VDYAFGVWLTPLPQRRNRCLLTEEQCSSKRSIKFNKEWERPLSDIRRVKNARIPFGMHPCKSASRANCVMQKN